LQNGLPLPSSDEKDKLGRWRNTKALIVQIGKHIPYSVRAVCITNLFQHAGASIAVAMETFG
jgi:hypothetical protein